MAFEDNWVVPVLHDGPQKQVMIDPVLKVAMWLIRPRQELDENNRSLILYYDPQIQADHIEMPMSQQDVDEGFWRKGAVPERPMEVFKSKERRKIAYDIGFKIEKCNLENNGNLIIK